jgi:hypothetical protein
MPDETIRQTAEQDADPRVDLAVQRTELAEDRTLLAWIRTSMALMGTGVAFDKGVQYFSSRKGRRRNRVRAERALHGFVLHSHQYSAACLCSLAVPEDAFCSRPHQGRKSSALSGNRLCLCSRHIPRGRHSYSFGHLELR